jgi:1-acyl-sn-glycerol-3-phosphate acyltransferase
MLDVPVIPIAIVVRPRAWGKRLRVPLPPRVVVRICPPSFPSQFGIRGIRDRGAIAAMRDSVRAGMIRAMRETGRADR